MIKLKEHNRLLILLGKIEDYITSIEDPFSNDIIEYKKYIELMTNTMICLNNTINIDKKLKEIRDLRKLESRIWKISEEDYENNLKSLNGELENIKNVLCN